MSSGRLLIVAGEAASGLDEIPAAARPLIEAGDELLVVAPALPTRIAWLASDADRTRELADQRLQTVLGQISDLGTPAEGVIGADDPLPAFEDAVADFHPDHILISLRGPEDSAGRSKACSKRYSSASGCP